MKENILYPRRDAGGRSNHKQGHILELKCLIFSLFITINIVVLPSANAQNGATLYTENCVACHAAMTGGDGSVLYTRDDRSVKSSEALNKQVNRCQSSLGLNWSNAQISSVQQYLNKTFYKF